MAGWMDGLIDGLIQSFSHSFLSSFICFVQFVHSFNSFIPFLVIPFHSIPFHSIPFHFISFHFIHLSKCYLICLFGSFFVCLLLPILEAILEAIQPPIRAHGLNAPSPTGVAKFVEAQAAGILLRVKKKVSEIHLQNGRDYHQHQLLWGILGDIYYPVMWGSFHKSLEGSRLNKQYVYQYINPEYDNEYYIYIIYLIWKPLSSECCAPFWDNGDERISLSSVLGSGIGCTTPDASDATREYQKMVTTWHWWCMGMDWWVDETTNKLQAHPPTTRAKIGRNIIYTDSSTNWKSCMWSGIDLSRRLNLQIHFQSHKVLSEWHQLIWYENRFPVNAAHLFEDNGEWTNQPELCLPHFLSRRLLKSFHPLCLRLLD